MSRSRSLPASDPRGLVARVRRNLVQRCGVARGARLLVAVSGGADSVALLALLAEIAPRLGLGLEVAHFDHALRTDSAEDARRVADLASARGLAFHVSRWTSPRPGEAAARAARHAYLAAVARAQGASAIGLAHHLDDQIETAILRLERGAGLRGAGGMAWRRGGRVPIVRPLLDIRRGRLLRYLEAGEYAWREDPTNADRRMARNRVRHELVPALDAVLRSGWMERWGSGLEELREVSQWIDDLARDLLRAAGEAARVARAGSEAANAAVGGMAPESAVVATSMQLDRGTLLGAPEIVLRRALQRWIEAATPLGTAAGDGDASRSAGRRQIVRRHLQAAARIVRTAHSGQRLDLPGGLTLWVEERRVRLARTGREEGEPRRFLA